MNRVQFRHNDQVLNITTFRTTKEMNISTTLQCNCHQLFSTCFREVVNNTCEPMFPFHQPNGCSMVVSDQQDQALLLASFIYNPLESTVEVYNICKNPDNKGLSAYQFLVEFINEFIPNNTLLPGCHTIRLALLCDNKYVVPAFITYCKLGFQVDVSNQPLSSVLPPHITMSRPITDTTQSDPTVEFKKMCQTCQYTPDILKSIQNTIDQRLPTVDFTSPPVDGNNLSHRQVSVKFPVTDPTTR
jgi:hypothetical protein